MTKTVPISMQGWRQFLGIKYKYLGRSTKGCDCYGLLLLYAKEILNVELPDWFYEEDWVKRGHNYFTENYEGYAYRVDVPEVHDVLLICTDPVIKVPNHCGILVKKPNMFIQATYDGVISSYTDSLIFRDKIEGAYRIKR